ncbi:MAG: DNA polymerase III subunit alpha [Desulfovibrio aminophilus]|jgi:DNA polymerase III, alpha subunit (EC 2.7.7.7)|uniref:DNA polymerase III subunit alpha n=1 Tax=Desulfovibrio aminophilus TaxID=81425 RepID=UPI002A42C061|nr:DNA polymerase III subunit alpha [Desulfovibrionaceae bacterium]
MSDFVHLHVHSEYSLLDGAIRLPALCQRAKDFGMPAVAVTDHGNMHAAVTFYQYAKQYGIKPLIGCETYVAQGAYTEKTGKLGSAYHLLLLAQNAQGYKNLIRLVSMANMDGFYYKPRVDKELLRRHGEGIIACSACLAGEVCRKLLNEGLEAGVETAREYADIFPGRFYLELQSNGLKEQEQANSMLLQVAERTGLPLVATNDCHYLDRADAEAHDTLLCIQTQVTVDQQNRMRMDTDQLYFKPPEEMEASFAHCPEALANTARIAEACELEIELGKHVFPVYTLPEGRTIVEEFELLARDGLKKRLAHLPYQVDEAAYWERLEYEIGVIKEMGFPAYFLIVQDFINWAKDNRIPVGPGRGSAAGSLVAWALRITNLDPLPYDLLFERFLNVERVSMPDIDVDFCERRRTEVIKYVSGKYGEDHVAQITTFGTMKAKAVVRDVGRALGLTFAETDKIAKLIPDDLKMTIDKALDKEPELVALAHSSPQMEKLVDISRRLEGLCRHASTHAAGVVISAGPMTDYLPLYRGKKGEVVTQYDMKRVEKVGLIKFDFLGLRTMTVIEDCLDIIREQGKQPPDLDTLALSDPKTYEIFARGDTDGVFQVESSGMRRYLRMLKPNCFEDLIAMLALYRPGPLGSGMVDEFIKRKHGEVEVTYPHPSLESVLKPTYGVIVYQEQVMSTARVIANYSLGAADLLRRAMGKKNAEEMAKQRKRFLEGSRENGIADKTANEIFDLMEKFAEYGFNKSHSAAYALISYFTAYLKAYFPVEFMASLISSELADTDKVFKYINTCRDMGVKVLPPDINSGRPRFSVHDGAVVFGLSGIKNVGEEAVLEIVEERERNGPYTDLVDLCRRVNLRRVTKRMLEYLIKAGAMDCFGCSRAGLLAGLDKAHALGQRQAKEKQSGMISMLDMLGGPDKGAGNGLPVNIEEFHAEEWPDEEKLRLEKEALGFFLSSHPLLGWRHELARLRLNTLDECRELANGSEVRLALLFTSVKEYVTKKGDKMAFVGAEDLTATGEVTLLPNVYLPARELIAQDQPLLVSGRIDLREEPGQDDEGPRQAKILAESVSLLSGAVAGNTEPVYLQVPSELCLDEHLNRLKELLSRHRGDAPVYVQVGLKDSVCTLQLSPQFGVAPNPEFWKQLDKWRGPLTAGN